MAHYCLFPGSNSLWISLLLDMMSKANHSHQQSSAESDTISRINNLCCITLRFWTMTVPALNHLRRIECTMSNWLKRQGKGQFPLSLASRTKIWCTQTILLKYISRRSFHKRDSAGDITWAKCANAQEWQKEAWYKFYGLSEKVWVEKMPLRKPCQTNKNEKFWSF